MTENEVGAAALTSKVYVFNCYNEVINGLKIAGNTAGDVAGWSTTAGTKYTPSQLAVPRSKFPSEDDTATFAIGENDVFMRWTSFSGTVTVVIPDPKESTGISLEEDLILFLTRNQAILLTTKGYIRGTFNVVLKTAQGELVTAE